MKTNTIIKVWEDENILQRVASPHATESAGPIVGHFFVYVLATTIYIPYLCIYICYMINKLSAQVINMIKCRQIKIKD